MSDFPHECLLKLFWVLGVNIQTEALFSAFINLIFWFFFSWTLCPHKRLVWILHTIYKWDLRLSMCPLMCVGPVKLLIVQTFHEMLTLLQNESQVDAKGSKDHILLWAQRNISAMDWPCDVGIYCKHQRHKVVSSHLGARRQNISELIGIWSSNKCGIIASTLAATWLSWLHLAVCLSFTAKLEIWLRIKSRPCTRQGENITEYDWD